MTSFRAFCQLANAKDLYCVFCTKIWPWRGIVAVHVSSLSSFRQFLRTLRATSTEPKSSRSEIYPVAREAAEAITLFMLMLCYIWWYIAYLQLWSSCAWWYTHSRKVLRNALSALLHLDPVRWLRQWFAVVFLRSTYLKRSGFGQVTHLASSPFSL